MPLKQSSLKKLRRWKKQEADIRKEIGDRVEFYSALANNSKINLSVKWPEYDAPLSNWVITDITFIEYVNNMRQNYEANAKQTLIVNQKSVEAVWLLKQNKEN